MYLSPLTLWVRIMLMARCSWYNIMWSSLSVRYGRSVVFSGNSGFLYQYNWPSRYNWNIVESGVKQINPTPMKIRSYHMSCIMLWWNVSFSINDRYSIDIIERSLTLWPFICDDTVIYNNVLIYNFLRKFL